MRNIKTREGFEFWDKLNALPRYAFLLSPSGKSVQKFEDKAMGNWIDVHEAQKIVDQAQDRISELRDELGAAKGEYDRAVNKLDDLQLRLNAADQRIDELTPPVSSDPATWGAPKTIRQLIQQLQTLDQDLRPLSMLRVPGNVFEDGKERTRAVHLSISHERVDGQWLAPFKSEGEKVLAFWCRMEQPDRSPEDYAIEHAEYMAKSADDVLAKFQTYGLALLAVDEGGDDGEGELFEAIDSARQDLQESLLDLRGMVYEFRKRSNRCTPQ